MTTAGGDSSDRIARSACAADGRVKKWGGELVGVDYAQLAREGEASRTYLLKRFGVTTDEMRAGR